MGDERTALLIVGALCQASPWLDPRALQDLLATISQQCSESSLVETEMRALMLAFVLGLALAASVQAAPLALKPTPIELRPAPPVELVRDGCGRGWHRTHWRDQWGNWQWGDCVPYGAGYGYEGRGAGWYYPYPDWRGVLPRWGWGYQ